MSDSPILQRIIAAAFRLVPQRRRFALAMRLSAPLAAVLRALLFLMRRRLRLATPRELTLAILLGALDARRVRYTVPQPAESVRSLGESAARTGALLVTTHANAGLARLVLSQADAAGIPLVVISGAPGFPIAGAARSLRTIAPEGTFLVSVRNCWRRGEVVASMVDTTPRDGNRRVELESGSFVVADPIVRLAARCSVPVFFMTARIEEGRVAIDLRELDARPDEDAFVAELVRSLSGELVASR